MNTILTDIVELSDSDVERISDEALEAAVHAGGFIIANPYPVTSAAAAIFAHCFATHYARINGK